MAAKKVERERGSEGLAVGEETGIYFPTHEFVKKT
jgi:hypothetical protein